MSNVRSTRNNCLTNLDSLSSEETKEKRFSVIRVVQKEIFGGIVQETNWGNQHSLRKFCSVVIDDLLCIGVLLTHTIYPASYKTRVMTPNRPIKTEVGID